MHPKLSILMPVHNGAPFLPQAIASMLGQTFSDFEFLILDDGSSDETPAILRAYAAKDPRIRIVPGARRGLVATLNDGLSRVRGDLVARMDADDVSHPERIERQYGHMLGDPDLWVLGTQWDFIDPEGRRSAGWKRMPTAAHDVAKTMPRYNAVHHPTVLMRRDRILALGGYRAAYQHAEDYDLWLRVIENGGRIENLDWIGLSYRMDGLPKGWQGVVGQISADLARATHALRAAGSEDPTQGMLQPPPLNEPSMLDSLIPDTIGFYRLLHDMATSRSAGQAHRLMRAAWCVPLERRHRRQFQEMLMRLVRSRSHWDVAMALGLLRALALHPGRFVRLMRGAIAGPQVGRPVRRVAGPAPLRDSRPYHPWDRPAMVAPLVSGEQYPMADALVPHFANDQGAEKIYIGVREFQCMGARPPHDHPHVYLDMGTDSQILCPYCSTLYVFTNRLAPGQTEPGGCLVNSEENDVAAAP